MQKPKAKAPAKSKAGAKAASTKTKPTTKKLVQTTLKSKTVPKKRAKAGSGDENEDGDSDVASFHDASILSTTPPNAKKQKTDSTLEKAGGAPLQEVDNESTNVNGTSKPHAKKKTATEQYQKLTQLEHIIKRPDTYIGSVERLEQQMWVFNSENDQMELRQVSFVPGLYKIFDEILVNAADNKQRDPSMSYIKVTINREKGEISVENNGAGIPVEIHDVSEI